MPLSGQYKLQSIKFYYAKTPNSTWYAVVIPLYGKVMKDLQHKTIQRVVAQLEIHLTLHNKEHTGSPKSVVIGKNVEKVKWTLEESPQRSVRTISKRLKLSSTSVWRIIRIELKKFPYKIQMKQKQTQNNKECCVQFGNEISDKIEEDSQERQTLRGLITPQL